MKLFQLLMSATSTPVFVLCVLSVVVLSGCSMEDSDNRDIDTSNARRAKLETNVGVEDLRDLATPPNLQKGEHITATATKSRGLNLEPQSDLFKEKLRSSDDRLDRLESAVQDMRNEFDGMSPAINRLVATEKDIQDLLGQLRTLVEGENGGQFSAGGNDVAYVEKAEVPGVVASEAPAAAVPAPPPPPAAAQPPPAPPPVKAAAAASPSTGQNVRIADHADKTRIVFETSTKQDYVVSFDEAEQLVLVEMSSSVSETGLNTLKNNSKRVSGANLSAQEGGKNVLAITTQSISRVTPGVQLAPSADNSSYRYYFDLIP